MKDVPQENAILQKREIESKRKKFHPMETGKIAPPVPFLFFHWGKMWKRFRNNCKESPLYDRISRLRLSLSLWIT